mmetsp:Transcript_35652/g.63421  ORF Transcript_35652/g.63421 Transcript_35652/m.63421 type:complete len:267 (+) Transcript_35652:78-878(+)
MCRGQYCTCLGFRAACEAVVVVLVAILAALWGARWGGTRAATQIIAQDYSLYYGLEADLRYTTAAARRIPQGIYSEIVANFIVPCVDVVLEAEDGQVLLLERGQEPMQGVLWLIGGRMWKGETFFDTAIRKVHEEVGLSRSSLRPLRVLGVWNTFFDRSTHAPECNGSDNAPCRGAATQTVNTVVHMALLGAAAAADQGEHVENNMSGSAPIQLDRLHTAYRWVPPDDLTNLDPYVSGAIRVAQGRCWNPECRLDMPASMSAATEL